MSGRWWTNPRRKQGTRSGELVLRRKSSTLGNRVKVAGRENWNILTASRSSEKSLTEAEIGRQSGWGVERVTDFGDWWDSLYVWEPYVIPCGLYVWNEWNSDGWKFKIVETRWSERCLFIPVRNHWWILSRIRYDQICILERLVRGFYCYWRIYIYIVGDIGLMHTFKAQKTVRS